jgi:hypothetical protein
VQDGVVVLNQGGTLDRTVGHERPEVELAGCRVQKRTVLADDVPERDEAVGRELALLHLDEHVRAAGNVLGPAVAGLVQGDGFVQAAGHEVDEFAHDLL